MRTLFALAVVGALIAFSLSWARAQPSAIVATFDVQGETFRVRIENPTTIEQVLALERGESTASIPNGRVVRGSDGNEPWNWHLDPNDIEMAEFAIELCDGTPSMVEGDIDNWVDTVGRYCPWGARLISVDEEKETRGICIDAIGTFDPRFDGGGCYFHNLGKDEVTVSGRALLDDDYAAEGTVFTALVDGQECGHDVGGSRFTLVIVGAGERDGCAEAGDVVHFMIGETEAHETYTWPQTTQGLATFSLTAVNDFSWYWFERASYPPARVGLRVEAYVGETLCAETFLGGESDVGGFAIPANIRGFSRLVVPSAARQNGCGSSGSTVEFRVDGLRAEPALVWQPGVQRLDLHIEGDASCDFAIDARDALLALQAAAALIAGTPCPSDVDHDSDTDAIDAQLVLQYEAGLLGQLG